MYISIGIYPQCLAWSTTNPTRISWVIAMSFIPNKATLVPLPLCRGIGIKDQIFLVTRKTK